MTETNPGGDHAADAPLDRADERVLAEVAALLDTVDPVPAGLVDRVRFALALDEVYDEVAQVARVPEDALSVRSDMLESTRTESLTFSSPSLTAMVTLSPVGPGRVRLDGWVSPVGARRVTVRMQGGSHAVVTDEHGRFVVEEIREGFVHLVFYPLAGDHAGLVVTPLFKL